VQSLNDRQSQIKQIKKFFDFSALAMPGKELLHPPIEAGLRVVSSQPSTLAEFSFCATDY
jgi:hypothetical protein